MKQSVFGLILFFFLMLPPVADLLESIMIFHMHMQMPLLIVAGFLMGKFFLLRFPAFLEKWNEDGIAGILLFVVINLYWMLPRTMDEALSVQMIEIFKFVSLPFLAGVPLRDSWMKLTTAVKNAVIILFSFLFVGLGLVYTLSPVELCNNYLLKEQVTLGWGFLTMAACFIVYLIYTLVVDPSKYE
ncbi:hypothetical protein [Pseudalkalibacillus caeni]|uniref:Uncharacterized protein n=1 Tax=Exobacillus caeni TaxID=2574798 RepID=A0A5R9EZR6_9BACL|nr:hypothetical protein [Pseudalkalibacillus caeni]TLS36842.1 hypothetical protein FCL54_12860 [Pseudalkalibacillus caeni]